MALEADPRFSDKGRRTFDQRIDDAYENTGIGPGLIVLFVIALGLVLFGPTIGLQNPHVKMVDNSPAHSTVR
jgi:hypothetical protein